MAQLTTFRLSCKTLDRQNIYINDLGNSLIDRAILEALMEYSEAEPRGFRTATIEIEVGDTEIVCPADCLDLDDSAAFLLYYGSSPVKYDVPGSYPLRVNSFNANSNSPLSYTTDNPSSGSLLDPAAIPKSTSDLGRITIQLASPVTQARSHAIRYNAYHVISDSPDMNTVPARDQRKVRQLVLGHLAEARRRQAIEQQNFEAARELEKAANQYFSEARESFGGAFGGIY